jgi:sporulation protein YlmC with PRC-barrel domain
MPAPRRSLHARADLLDRPLVDEDGRLVGKVDDLELTDPAADGPPRLTAVLTGPDALEPRLSRLPFRWWATHRRRRGRPARIVRIPFERVRDVGVGVVVPADTRGYEESERRLRDRLIGRIPGARHADE